MVIMDEINSQPMLESLLNNLLMGQGSDGKRPAKPGFTLIGTGNPIYMDGRRKMSQALKRRMMHVEFSKYPEAELIEVATKRRMIETHPEALSEIDREVNNSISSTIYCCKRCSGKQSNI